MNFSILRGSQILRSMLYLRRTKGTPTVAQAKRKSLKTISRENECLTSNLLTVLYFIISLINGKRRKKIQKSNSSVTEMKIE